MKEVCDFGKEIKKKLVDLEQSQVWLIEKVKDDTGLYFDGSYLHKIVTGVHRTPSVVASICKILDIKNPYQN